jgi:hypothetical protein
LNAYLSNVDSTLINKNDDEYIHIKKNELVDYVRNLIEGNLTVDSYISNQDIKDSLFETEKILNFEFSFMGKRITTTQIKLPYNLE